MKKYNNENVVLEDEIISIIKIGEEEVFDLEMEFEPHNYIANGIVSHNSHSVAYTLLTYWAQYAKIFHPVEFWTTSLQLAHEEDIPQRISEMRKLKQGIKIQTPNVNYSATSFTCDRETYSIYWSLSKIKGLGPSVVPKIIAEREKNGKFLSYDEFKSRFAKKDVNKGKLLALILGGAFDEIENIEDPEDRLDLVKKHYASYEEPLPDSYKVAIVHKRYYWILIQKELTGFGTIDFAQLIGDDPKLKKYKNQITEADVFLKLKNYGECCVVGTVMFINQKESKRGKWLRVTIMSNQDLLSLNIWSETYLKYQDILNESVGKMLMFTDGKANYNEYQGFNCFNSTEKTAILEI